MAFETSDRIKATWPCSMPRSRSQCFKVDKRWAMIKTVRPMLRRSITSIISLSVFISMELVGSSRMRMGAFFRKARASAIRWRCPPDNCIPRSPTASYIAVRKTSYKLMRFSGFCSLNDFILRGAGTCIGDVLADAGRKKYGFLKDDAELIAKLP